MRRKMLTPEQQALADERKRLYQACQYFIPGHGAENFNNDLAALLAFSQKNNFFPDRYGSGKFIQEFEAEIARLLGKEDAVFVISGTMAQQIAIKIWSERSGRKQFGLHATSHLEQHEYQSYAQLHQLESVLLGNPAQPFLASDLRNTLAAIVLELPYRDLAGDLPSWDELLAMRAYADSHGTKLHMDGARLWEAQPYYQKSFSEIAALFDSVYLSFYKGLGGMTGAILAGPADFIDEARVWIRRHGGNLYTQHPYVLSAKLHYDKYAQRFPVYFQRTQEIHALIRENFPQITPVLPEPKSCLFHLRFSAAEEKLLQARDFVAREKKAWLFPFFSSDFAKKNTITEITIGEAALAFTDRAIIENIQVFLEQLDAKNR